VPHAGGELLRLVRNGRVIGDRGRIEHDESAAYPGARWPRRRASSSPPQRGEAPHGFLQRRDLFLAHVLAEEAAKLP